MITTRRQRSSRKLRGAVVGLSSTFLLAALLGFSYVYTQRPDLLPVDWLQRLDDFRAGLE